MPRRSFRALIAGSGRGRGTSGESPRSRIARRSPARPLAVKKLLEQKFPCAVVRGVTKSPYFGLYEVQFDDQIVYTDAKVNYVIVGSVYDANTKQNLTEAKLRKLNRVAFDSLPLDLAFKRVKGNGSRKLVDLLGRRLPVLREAREAS